MATSETQIANLALAHLGNSKGIASLTERSAEARACLLFYEQCRDEALGAFPWPFATVINALPLLNETPAEYRYSYGYPTDALTVYRIPSGFDRAAVVWPYAACDWPYAWPAIAVPYRVVQVASAKRIYTDLADASIEYTRCEKDPTRYPADFTKALSLKLAGDIAPMITGGDTSKLGIRALQRYEDAIRAAKVRAANEDQPDPPRESELVTSRY